MPSLVKDLADALSLSADEANGRKSQVRPSRDDLREFAEAVLGALYIAVLIGRIASDLKPRGGRGRDASGPGDDGSAAGPEAPAD